MPFEGVSSFSTIVNCTKRGDYRALIADCVRSYEVSHLNAKATQLVGGIYFFQGKSRNVHRIGRLLIKCNSFAESPNLVQQTGLYSPSLLISCSMTDVVAEFSPGAWLSGLKLMTIALTARILIVTQMNIHEQIADPGLRAACDDKAFRRAERCSARPSSRNPKASAIRRQLFRVG